MTRLLPVLTGHPHQLRGLADSLMGSASRLSAVNTVLLGLRAGAEWDSDSGRLFESAVQAPPPIIAAAIERYAGAARSLRTLADELEEAQREVTEAIVSNTEAWRRHDDFMERRGLAVDPVEQQDLERAMNAEVALVHVMERRHLAAVHRYREADRRCARGLRALAQDVLDDPTGYTWLANTGKAATPVALVGGLLPGPGRLVGVAGIAGGALSRVGLLVLYDEGSWKQLGVNVLSSAVTTFGSVLVAGARIGGKVAIEGGERIFTKTANPSTGFRVGAGARSTFDDWVDGWRRKVGLPVIPKVPPVPPRALPEAETWFQRGTNAGRTALDNAVVNSWQLATANGPQAQRMFVAGVTLRTGPAVAKQVNGVHDRLTPPPEEKSEEKAARSTYP